VIKGRTCPKETHDTSRKHKKKKKNKSLMENDAGLTGATDVAD
jgi:hypothetical protein